MVVSTKLMEKSSVFISKTEKSPIKISRSASSMRVLGKLPQYPSVPEVVEELVQELAKVDNVRRVRAVAPRATEIHIIEFELELHPETELSDESWDKIRDLVIDCEWDLRDKTKEKWYFHAELVENFAKDKEGAKVVAVSYIQPYKLLETTWSFSTYPAKIMFR